MVQPPRVFFAGLVDDAAMFPPGNATASTAIAEHLRYRGAWFADLIGPLLVPAKGWDSFVAAHAEAGAPALSVVLIGTATLPTPIPNGITVAGFEMAVSDIPLPAIPRDLSLAAEITPGVPGYRVLAAVTQGRSSGASLVAKYRTGGTSADAFPSEHVLAEVICAAAALGSPLKLTAGLHHAVRFTDPNSRFEHHGFVNVMLAVARAQMGDERATVAEILAERDAEIVAGEVATLAPRLLDAVRHRFVSFGCCGVEDPVHDLVALDLLTPPHT